MELIYINSISRGNTVIVRADMISSISGSLDREKDYKYKSIDEKQAQLTAIYDFLTEMEERGSGNICFFFEDGKIVEEWEKVQDTEPGNGIWEKITGKIFELGLKVNFSNESVLSTIKQILLQQDYADGNFDKPKIKGGSTAYAIGKNYIRNLG